MVRSRQPELSCELHRRRSCRTKRESQTYGRPCSPGDCPHTAERGWRRPAQLSAEKRRPFAPAHTLLPEFALHRGGLGGGPTGGVRRRRRLHETSAVAVHQRRAQRREERESEIPLRQVSAIPNRRREPQPVGARGRDPLRPFNSSFFLPSPDPPPRLPTLPGGGLGDRSPGVRSLSVLRFRQSLRPAPRPAARRRQHELRGEGGASSELKVREK